MSTPATYPAEPAAAPALASPPATPARLPTTNASAIHTGKLNALQALRAVAAGSVVLFHSHWVGVSSFGVELFFVISGFVICLVGAGAAGGDGFLLKRACRVIPLYWGATLAITALALAAPGLVPSVHPGLVTLVKSLLFIPFLRDDGLTQPLLFLGWTLNYEAFFYVLFAACLLLARRAAPMLCLLALIALALLHPLLAPLGLPLDYWTSSVILNFAVGILVWMVWSRREVTAARGSRRFYAVLALISLALLISGVHPHTSPLIPWKGLLGGVLILSCLALEKSIRWPALLLVIGEVSYSLYLLHPYVLELFNRKVLPLGPTPAGILVSLLAWTTCLALAAASFKLVENPSNRYLRAHIKRWQTTRAPRPAKPHTPATTKPSPSAG